MPSQTSIETTLAATLAGEDIQCGDFVTVSHDTVEFASFLWCDSVTQSPEEPVRVRFKPSDAGLPHKVIGVCLPFVYTKTPYDRVTTFDLRQCQLVRLNEECASMIWKEMKPKTLSKKKSKKNRAGDFMRSDMDKVIVERPRIGSREPSRKKGYRKFIQSTSIENLPRREPMLGRWRGRGKWLNEHLGPMRRFLRSNVGRPWNKIHQELCEHVSFANAVQSHVLDHIFDYVHVHVEVMDSSTVFSNQRDWWRHRKLQAGDMYVCPRTGILRTVRKNRRQKPAEHVDRGQRVQHCLRDGSWWQIRLESKPDHLADQWDVWLEKSVEELPEEILIQEYGGKFFAVSKRPLNKNEVRALRKRMRSRKVRKH